MIGFALVPLSYYLLWRTRFGLRLRSCGENPVAAESLGVNVYRYKYIGVVVSGALAGLAGAALVLNPGQLGYLEGQTGGRGYIGLAAMIFGNWAPVGLLAGSALFGYVDGLQLRAGGEAVHALLYAATLIAVVVAVLLGGPAQLGARGRRAGRRRGRVRDLLVDRHGPARVRDVRPAAGDAGGARRGRAASATTRGGRARSTGRGEGD